MRTTLFLAFLLYVASYGLQAFAAGDAAAPKFSDYPTTIYSGSLRIPSYYVNSDGMWRDDMGKTVAPPKVNLAGKYYVGLHSCGTECRYYTLSDLTTGIDSKALDIFSSDGVKPQKISDGRAYVTELISHPESKLVIAQYHIDPTAEKPAECREKMFLLSDDGQKVSPLTKTLGSCGTR